MNAPDKIVFPLGSVNPGMVGTLDQFIVDNETTDRLREMGFSEGLTIEVQHESFLGRDPIVVQVGQMIVALRREDANLMLIANSDSAAGDQ